MSDARDPLHAPVSTASTEDARRLLAVEEHARGRRADRQLAKLAMAIAALLLLSFCGTGFVVNAQRSAQLGLWRDFMMVAAETDCCYSPGSMQDPMCIEAAAGLEKLARVQRAGPSTAERVAAWFHRTIGLEPMAWDVRTPDPAMIDELRARCDAARKGAK